MTVQNIGDNEISVIINKLSKFPVNLRIKNTSLISNASYMFLFLFMGLYFIFFTVPFLTGGGQPLIQDNGISWLNLVLAFISIVCSAYFCLKLVLTPYDVNHDLTSTELENLLTVARYNAAVKSYKDQNVALKKRDYYYLNIDEQVQEINNITGTYELKQILKLDLKPISIELSETLNRVKIKTFISHHESLKKSKAAKRKGIICFVLFLAVILVTSFIDIPYTHAIRVFVGLLFAVLFFTMIGFFLRSVDCKNEENQYLNNDKFDSVKFVCEYSQKCRDHVELVLKDGRPLLDRDYFSIQAYAQKEAIECDRLLNGN